MNESRPFQILQIAPGDLWAGAESQLYNLATGLSKLPEVAVCVILLNNDTLANNLKKAGIEVIIIDEKKLGSFEILRKLIQIIRVRQPDIIHTHRAKINIFGSIAAYVSGRVPSLRTAHGSQEHPPSWKQIGKRLILFTERLCDLMLHKKIIAVSENLGEMLKKDFPINKISIIENGINSAQLINNIKSGISTANYNNGTFRAGIAGRLVPIKRVDLFIKAAHHFKQQHPEKNIYFHIFGDGPLREELEALNTKLQTNDIVHFEGHSDNMAQTLQTLDALLMTSDHEGLPMILLEAMALETPIVAHDAGGITNLLDQGKCGILVKDHSGEGYAKALYSLVNDASVRNNITKHALKRVTTVYSAQKNAQAHQKLYEKICSSLSNHINTK